MTNKTFSQLALSPELLEAVTEMGFTEATDIQAESIPLIRDGADVLARSQTGTGKTVAFGIPAVERILADVRNVQVLVLSPTRELAHQCGEEIRKLAHHLPYIKVADIFGGADYRGQFRELESANLVIGTPGRIMDHMRRGTLDLSHLKMVILDEADEMLNMGFREDIEVILQDVPKDRQIVLFSATIPEEILTIAQQFQRNPVRIEINREQITLENIKQVYVEIPPKQKPEALTLLLHYYQPHRALIFSNTKTMVDELTERLSAAGFSVEGLHGDMKQLQRTTVMNGFRKGRVSILVATDVAARGIDVSDLDYVINFDIPKEPDSYVHRIGRTGRAGRAGTAVTLCCGRAQVLQLQRLAARTRSGIAAIPLPRVSDIEQAHRERTLKDLEHAMDMTDNTDPRYSLAQGIHKDADWLHSLVENILSLTRLQDGRLTITKQPEAAEEVIGGAVSHVMKRYPEYEIMGSILRPMEEEEGYASEFSAAVNIASGPTGMSLKACLSRSILTKNGYTAGIARIAS